MILRSVLLCCLFVFSLSAQSKDESDVIAAAQKVFDGMAAHDAAMIRSAVLADARFYSVRNDAAPTSTSAEDFITRITAMKNDLLERFTGKPTVLIKGRIAQVWSEYDFLLDGKFGHCGIDSFSLLKTNDGWKVASIVYTTETAGCAGH